MQLEGYVQLIRDDLGRIAAVGDETTAQAAELLSAALESALARRLQEALAEAALELSDSLEQGTVEVRVSGGDPELVYVGAEPAAEPASDEALDARITLRLPDRLKTRLDDAAAAAGVSVNTWLVQVLHRSLEPRQVAPGQRRLTGYGRA
jgi:plasmid stability protein